MKKERKVIFLDRIVTSESFTSSKKDLTNPKELASIKKSFKELEKIQRHQKF